MDIEWGDPTKARPGNEKYPAMLEAIKESSLVGDHRNWGVLTEMSNEASARDLASRLARTHEEFEVISRKEGEVTTVFARLREEVTA